MRFLTVYGIQLLFLGVAFSLLVGCNAREQGAPSATQKTTAQLTIKEFRDRLADVFREPGSKVSEIQGIFVGGVCDAAALERAFGKPHMINNQEWSWNVKDGWIGVTIEAEKMEQGKRILTINGITSASEQVE